MRRVSRAKKSSPPAKPRFLWQGLLIVLPVLVLAAFGAYSLRVDRQGAEQEAVDQARRVAENLLDRYEQELTNTLATQGLVIGMDTTGKLLHPPPVQSVPEPHPLDLTTLSPEQQQLFSAALQQHSPEPWRKFLVSKPPPDFAAQAGYNLGLALKSASTTTPSTAAAEAFSTIITNHPTAFTESGLPLAPLAQLQWLETTDASAENKLSALQTLVSNTLAQPSFLTPALFPHISRLEHALRFPGQSNTTSSAETLPLTHSFATSWEQQKEARALHALIRSQLQARIPEALSSPRLLWLNDDSWADRRSEANGGLTNDSVLVSTPALALSPIALQKLPGVTLGTKWLILCSGVQNNRLKLLCLRKESDGWFGPSLSLLEKAGIPEYAGVSVSVAGQPIGTSTLSYLYQRAKPRQSDKWSLWYAGNSSGLVEPGRSRDEPPWIEYILPTAREFQSWKCSLATSSPKTLATARRDLDGSELLRVNIHLAKPELLYEKLRVRTLWLGLLIGTAALAAFIGWLAAWRAFHRQHQLAALKTNFVSSVSHELRAPIASVRLMAEGLERGKIREPAKQHQYFRFIVQECRRLSSLVENVLDFSRIEQGRKEYEFESTDLKALVQQTVNLMLPSAEERQIKLETKLPSEPVSADVDGRAIQQALVNLLDNALKHSPSNSVVQVGLELITKPQNPDPDPPSGHTPAPFIHLWVEDHGSGIPPEDHERIFERFYRRGSELRRETQGVGIGLSIVKHIVEAHGGRVLVRSALNQGSRFTIELTNGK